MAYPEGTHRLGPANANLSVRTGRGGAAAKAGHDLLIGVTSWEATLVLGSDASETTVELTADATSLRVIKGTGGMQALDADSIDNIQQTIDDEVLKRQAISFRSTAAAGADGRIAVTGELAIVGRAEPITFDLEVGDDGALSASATVTQSNWGMKPYSALFGALKVSDDVEVILDGHL